ncbi:hypothetical protein ISN44_As06g038640, partial [Arabidopsis suecica]
MKRLKNAPRHVLLSAPRVLLLQLKLPKQAYPYGDTTSKFECVHCFPIFTYYRL